MTGHRFLSFVAWWVGGAACIAMIACKPAPVKPADPDQAWLQRLGSGDALVRETALDELWTQKDSERLARLLAKAPATQDGIRRRIARLELGIAPGDPPRFIELSDRVHTLAGDERQEFMRLFQNLPVERRLLFAAAALQRAAGDPKAMADWAGQADSAIHGMENRITQRAEWLEQAAPGGMAMQLVTGAQTALRDSLLAAADRVIDQAARAALIKAMRSRFQENKVYSLTLLDYRWNRIAPQSSSKPVRAIQALLDLAAIDPAVRLTAGNSSAVDALVMALAYDVPALEQAVAAKPPRPVAVEILAKLARFPGWERKTGYAAACRLEEAWKPRPASDAEVTKDDRDFAYYMAAAALGQDEPEKAMEIASFYRHPAAAEFVGNRLRNSASMAPDEIARIAASQASREVKLEVLRQLSLGVGTMGDAELARFLELSATWFPTPDDATLPAWHTMTRGLAVLRKDRDWPAAIRLFNRVASDRDSGRHLSIEIHNRWPSWRKEGRLPVVDVAIMSPELFMSFLSEIEFQWENSPQNLKGYQLHLRGRELRWKLQSTDSEHLDLVRMAREAELAGDSQSSWELLQIVALGRLPLFHPWDTQKRFSSRFPMGAYLSLARARGAIREELERLDAYKPPANMNPPVILTAALALAQGDEAAAVARLEAEKKHPNVPMPATAERLELLRAYLADAQGHAADPAKWWEGWLKKGFPKD